MIAKKYKWLKVHGDFFYQKEIKKMMKLPEGTACVLVYLKIQLLSLETDGILTFDGIEENLAKQLSYQIDEDVTLISMVLTFLQHNKLIEEITENHYLLPKAIECMGKEGTSAERVRKHRERLKANYSNNNQIEEPVPNNIPALPVPKKEPYSNAKRQKMYRAKKYCSAFPYITIIDDKSNRELYDGDYYITLKKNKCRCFLCNGTEKLSVYNVKKRCENNVTKVGNSRNEIERVALCVTCFCNGKNTENGNQIFTDVSTTTFFDIPENGKSCNVTLQCNTEKDTEKDTDISKDICNTLCNENINLIHNQTNLTLSDNMKKIVSVWEIDRLRKAISIFNNLNGKYFSLLKKIYLDNNNFIDKFNTNINKPNSSYDELERALLGIGDDEEIPQTKGNYTSNNSKRYGY